MRDRERERERESEIRAATAAPPRICIGQGRRICKLALGMGFAAWQTERVYGQNGVWQQRGLAGREPAQGKAGKAAKG